MKRNLFCIIFLSFYFMSFSQIKDPDLILPEPVSAQLISSGGPYTTQIAGIDTLFTNPACFSNLQKQWAISRIGISHTKQIKPDTGKIENGNYQKINVGGPISFGLLGKNFAFGIFNRSYYKGEYTKLNLAKDKVIGNLYLGEEILIKGGYGGNIFSNEHSSVALGIQMKGFIQGFLFLQDFELAFSSNPFRNFSLIDPVALITGIGVDAGLLYNYNDFLRLGLTVRDLYTATFSSAYENLSDFVQSKPYPSYTGKYRMPFPNLSIGFSITPNIPKSVDILTGYSFFVDFQNFLIPIQDKSANLALNIATGMEFEFNHAYYFRFGLKELSPTFGLGVDMKYIETDFSFRFIQLAPKPWKKVASEFMLTISFKY